MRAVLVLSLLTLYLRRTRGFEVILWVIYLMGMLLALGIITCSFSRIRTYLTLRRSGSGQTVSLQEQVKLRLPGEAVLGRLDSYFKKRGFLTSVSRLELTAHKNRSGLLGSVAFHMGLVIMLIGFSVNFLWGGRGIMLAPEGIDLNTANDLKITSQGPLFKAVRPYYLRLERFSYSDETGADGKPLLRPVAGLVFRDTAGESRQQLRINNPVVFGDIRWRYYDSGYSLLLKIVGPQGVIVNDYANIASHQGKSWADIVEISPGLKIDIKFYPDFAENKNDGYISKSRFPNKPVMKLAVLQNERNTGETLIPLGQAKSVGDLQVSFSGFRYWVVLDAVTDPGRILILLGALISVGGLAWRIMRISKHFACQVEENEGGMTTVSWGVRTNYGKAMFREELLKVYNELEEIQGDNS